MTQFSPFSMPRMFPNRNSLARRSVHSVLQMIARRVPVNIVLPDGSVLPGPEYELGETSRPTLLVHDLDAFCDRLADDPKMAIGDGYVAEEWGVEEGEDLAAVLYPFARRMTTMVPDGLWRLRKFVDRPIPLLQRNTRAGAKRNIEAHYDLGNELFERFLDPTMTYSAAMFQNGTPWQGQSLQDAQLRKIHVALDRAGVSEGTELLEIGTGWGTLAIEAAKRGANVTTVTLSSEQLHFAQQRAQAAGVADRVHASLTDYRDVTGSFDAIISIEMVEAVGEEYWPTYFNVVDDLLTSTGTAVIQAILMPHQRYRETHNSYGWLHKRIFPGGLLPSFTAITDVLDKYTTLRVSGRHMFGLHYAETLRQWRQRFAKNKTAIASFGYDKSFCRMWEFYLAYVEAGFASSYIDVGQLVLAHDPLRKRTL